MDIDNKKLEYIFANRILVNIPALITKFEEYVDSEELETFVSHYSRDEGYEEDYDEDEMESKAAEKLIGYIKDDGVWEYFKLDEFDADTPEMDALQEITITYLNKIADKYYDAKARKDYMYRDEDGQLKKNYEIKDGKMIWVGWKE